MQPQSGACQYNTRGRPHPTRFLLSWVSHFLSFSFAGQLPWEGTLDMLPRRGDGRRAADVESDDIDKQSGNGQGTEQQCLWEDDAKEGIQRIVSRPYQAQSDADGHEHQRILIAALADDEAVFPMRLERGHEHGAEDPGGAQGRQEPKRDGEAAAHLSQDDQADPQPYRFEA